ncbi:MAG: cobalamin-binding protein [Thiobacillus sp.]
MLLAGWPVLAATILIDDDSGQRLTLERPPQRIISLSPHLTELLFAVGAGSQIVGVDSASDYPAAARYLPRVGDFSRIRLERILALKPDLIVAWSGGNRAADLHGIARLGIPVLRTEAVRLDDVSRLLKLLGTATGHPEAGSKAAQTYQTELSGLKRRYAKKTLLPVFYQIWDRPLMTVGGQHWISEALRVCGARNLFDDLDSVAPVVSREAVLLRMPGLIAGSIESADMQDHWQSFSQLPAVRKRAFIQVDSDRLHRATPRLINGVAHLCEALAPYQR